MIDGDRAAIAALPEVVAALEAGRRLGWHLGAQVAVRRRGDAVAELAVGEAAPGEPLTRDHRMLWLSSTKPVAAVAIGQLWERARLGLDDPIAVHWPEFGAGGKDRITIRHALTHTGGFRMLDVGFPRDSWETIVGRVAAAKLEPRWEPGKKAGYHQASSWFALGELVRRLDGRDFGRYAREEIFDPAGMAESWVGMPTELFQRERSRLAPLWNTEVTPARREPWDVEPAVVGCSPGGNGWGPMRDLALFYDRLLAALGSLDGSILRPQTVEALVARHRVGLFDQTFRAPLEWGLGFIPNSEDRAGEDAPYQYGPHASARAFGHSGYRSSTAFADPEHGLAVAIAWNGTPAEAAHRERLRQTLAALYRDLGLDAGESGADR